MRSKRSNFDAEHDVEAPPLRGWHGGRALLDVARSGAEYASREEVADARSLPRMRELAAQYPFYGSGPRSGVACRGDSARLSETSTLIEGSILPSIAVYSARITPEPPISFGRSFCFGRPSRTGTTDSP
jgi:hypothetical protein